MSKRKIAVNSHQNSCLNSLSDKNVEKVNIVNNITNKTVVLHGNNFNSPQRAENNTMITYQSLQEGDLFDKDIKRIMAIINGVEHEFNEKKVQKTFQNALNTALHRRGQ